MENANSLSSVDLVEELLSGTIKAYLPSPRAWLLLMRVHSPLSVEQGSTVVELGPGHGFALKRILEKRPSLVYGVEISESFRSILESDPDLR